VKTTASSGEYQTVALLKTGIKERGESEAAQAHEPAIRRTPRRDRNLQVALGSRNLLQIVQATHPVVQTTTYTGNGQWTTLHLTCMKIFCVWIRPG